MPGCSAFGCSNRSEQGYLMKAFPRDPIRRQQWVIQTKRANWTPTEKSVLCEVHFEDGMWEKTRADGSRKLKCNAIPTLFNFTTNMPKKKASRKNLLPDIKYTSQDSLFSSNINPVYNTVPALFSFTENSAKGSTLKKDLLSTSQYSLSSNINPVLIVRDTSMDILIPETSSVSISQMESSGSSLLYADNKYGELKQQLVNFRIINKKLRLNNRILRNKLKKTKREKEILQLKLRKLRTIVNNSTCLQEKE